MFSQPHLERGLDDRADERAETRIRILNIKLIAGAVQAHWQHAARMNQFDRRVHRKIADGFSARMLFFPLPNSSEIQILNDVFAVLIHVVIFTTEDTEKSNERLGSGKL